MLNRIIDEVATSIQTECFIAALASALTIPDICGKAEYPDATVAERYIRWYNNYIGQYEKPIHPHAQDMPYLSGELVYNLRNALLHQGNLNIDKAKVKEPRCRVDRFVLTISEPYDGGFSSLNCYGTDSTGENPQIVVRIIEVNIVNLCSKLVATAKGYYRDNQAKFDFFSYELKDIRKRPNCFENGY